MRVRGVLTLILVQSVRAHNILSSFHPIHPLQTPEHKIDLTIPVELIEIKLVCRNMALNIALLIPLR